MSLPSRILLMHGENLDLAVGCACVSVIIYQSRLICLSLNLLMRFDNFYETYLTEQVSNSLRKLKLYLCLY
jgi:hypothetical protein